MCCRREGEYFDIVSKDRRVSVELESEVWVCNMLLNDLKSH
ncbi:hypothetical protein VCRA2112O349_160016 [Vibrio crassostreae]|nr:hypothetical protein VCRA2115O371_140016 [Vibrio crassostreae]CAK1797688.1 hypothetical protein VCRA2114O369_160116 [Vibrio crassostreae]CAK1801852.1 hypothetical protein VCRA2113O357_170016 [Vibrio crassostreae]CAK2293271.1 hypothetical protein VCRA2113O355_150116 [Vibrio crassostreae]CAK2423398.1 hypothetical protein VCRA2114E366_160115 [Vibrio crassostreae]